MQPHSSAILFDHRKGIFSNRLKVISAVRHQTLVWLAALVGAACMSARAEIPDFDKARNFRKLTENKVFRDRVQPQWLPGNNQFCYRVKTGPDTHEFVFVDAEKGIRRVAFDHGRLANALFRATTKETDPQRLNLDGLEFKPDETSVEFRFGGKRWRCNLFNYTLSELETKEATETSLPILNTPHPSTRTGEETSLTFVNRTQGEVEVFWIDAAGERQSYGKLQAGGEREQHTFGGHVWLTADSQGKALAIFEAADKPGRAEIGAGGAQVRANRPARRDGASTPRRAPRDTSPDGQWRAAIKNHNVLVQNLQSGEETPLSTDGTADDPYTDRFYWSPDSKKLISIRNRPGEEHKVYFVESSPKNQVQPKLHTVDYRKPGDRIDHPRPQLFDVPAQKQIPVSDELFANPWSIGEGRWTPDGSAFTFLYNQRGHQVLRIVAIDGTSGAARAVVEERSPTFIDYNDKFFLRHLEDTRELIWMSERDGWNHLYLYDATTGRVKNQITRGDWVVRQVDRVDPGKRQIWFRAGGIRPGQDPYYPHYCRVNFDGSGLTVLTEGDGTHSLEYSPDNRFFIDTWSRVNLPPVTELRRAEDGRFVCELERADGSALLKTGWRAPQPFTAKGRDGVTDIYGVIIRPSHYDPQKKYPVIENIYAGPQGAFAPKRFSAYTGMQELAELGFIVVQLDGMGTSYRSKKFHDICCKNLGDAGFPDRILWIQAAARKDPAMDISRVGIYGTSAGGQNALRGLLAHGDFYKAGAADCGCHDNRMDKIWWNELWMGWPVGPHYDEQSNVTHAHKLKGKLLLMVGEMDTNVDPASTMQVVNALVKADKDFELLVVPGAGHGVAGSNYGRKRLHSFFVRSLLGESDL